MQARHPELTRDATTFKLGNGACLALRVDLRRPVNDCIVDAQLMFGTRFENGEKRRSGGSPRASLRPSLATPKSRQRHKAVLHELVSEYSPIEVGGKEKDVVA